MLQMILHFLSKGPPRSTMMVGGLLSRYMVTGLMGDRLVTVFLLIFGHETQIFIR